MIQTEGANPSIWAKTYYLAKFCRKRHENERNQTGGLWRPPPHRIRQCNQVMNVTPQYISKCRLPFCSFFRLRSVDIQFLVVNNKDRKINPVFLWLSQLSFSIILNNTALLPRCNLFLSVWNKCSLDGNLLNSLKNK